MNPNTNPGFRTNPAAAVKLILLALLAAGIALGCAQIRKATYPADFVYLEQRQVKSQMALLSLYMKQLDEILLDESTVSSEQQGRIIALLSRINASTDALGAGSVRTNHRVVDDHIDQFKSEVNKALRNASADPPNYYALGRLAGGCVACHKYR